MTVQLATIATFRELAALRPDRGVGAASGLADHHVAFVVGKPATAQAARTAREAWARLEAAVGAIEPADDDTVNRLTPEPSWVGQKDLW